uniref:Protein transport protein sec16 n=1 Tax=Panagrellus redivivus TaxID=6233 RepID=A0A7E4UQ52_PANRE
MPVTPHMNCANLNGQPDGMEVDSASEASDQPMPSQSPPSSDEEMPTRSPTPSDWEMEDLSTVFKSLLRTPSPSPTPDEEMEDLSMNFNLLFGDGSSNWQQQQHDATSAPVTQTDGGSNPVLALVPCTGVAEANAEETAAIQNTSFWSGNNAVFGPGSPMDWEDVDEQSTEANPIPVNTIDRISTPDASSILESSEDDETRVPVQGNVEELPRQEPPKIAGTTEPTTSTPEASKSRNFGDNSNIEEPAENGNAEEDFSDLSKGSQIENAGVPIAEESADAVVDPVLPEVNVSTTTNDAINPINDVSESSPSEVATTPMKDQQVKEEYQFNADPEPMEAELALKRPPRHCPEEPPYKMRKLMSASIAASEADEDENNANEAEIPHIDDESEEVASVAESVQPVQEDVFDAVHSPAVSQASDMDAGLNAPIEDIELNAWIEDVDVDVLGEVDDLDAGNQDNVPEALEPQDASDAEAQNAAYWVNVAQNDYDEAGEDEPGEPWRYADLPEDDDLNEEPASRLIDTEDNMSTEDEEDYGFAPAVPDQSQPVVAMGQPPDDDPSDDDDSSDDEDVGEHIPERSASPSPAPSLRPPTPVTPADEPQIDEVAEPTEFNDAEIEDAPVKQVNDEGDNSEVEPINGESDSNNDAEPDNYEVPPMDDISEADDVEMDESDDVVPSDVDTDQLVSEGSSEASEDDSMDVDEPEDLPLAAPQAAKPRSRNPVDPWKNVNAVDSFANATLPAPNNVVVKSWYVQEFNALTPDTLKQEVSGDSYIAALYNGIVVFQGSFDGVPLSSAFMSEAAVRPQVLYNDPTDPIKCMGGGRNHLVLLGESGRLYLIGRATEGQLGQDPSRHRYRAPTPINMRRRVLEEMALGPNGKPRVRSTPEIEFDDVEARGNATIAWSKNLAFKCGTSDDDAECWSTFKRYPLLDQRTKALLSSQWKCRGKTYFGNGQRKSGVDEKSLMLATSRSKAAKTKAVTMESASMSVSREEKLRKWSENRKSIVDNAKDPNEIDNWFQSSANDNNVNNVQSIIVTFGQNGLDDGRD